MQLRRCLSTVLIISWYILIGVATGLREDCGKSSSQLRVRFLFADMKSWRKPIINRFKSSLADFVNSYCMTNANLCGLRQTRVSGTEVNSNSVSTVEARTGINVESIKSSDIVILDDYPMSDGAQHSVVGVQVKLPSLGVLDKECSYLRRNVLKEIIKMNRKQLQKDLVSTASASQYTPSFAFRVSHVDRERVIPGVAHETNSIAIPIICALVVLLGIIVVITEINGKIQKQKSLQSCIQMKQLASKSSESSKNGSFAVVSTSTSSNTGTSIQT